ncbi:MAG: hypothetical protein J0L57_04495 [Burkholderiales bacterium]|nr:hypothetical protein [Burkholderiales bacterium]
MADDSDARGKAVQALLEFKAAELEYRQLGLEEVALADELQKPGQGGQAGAPDPAARGETLAIVRDRCNPSFE